MSLNVEKPVHLTWTIKKRDTKHASITCFAIKFEYHDRETAGHDYRTLINNPNLSQKRCQRLFARLIPGPQAFLRKLLSFDPRGRPRSNCIALETFFLMGHRQTTLDEDVFYTPYTPYTPINEKKRNDAPVQDEEETRTVQKAKYECDDLEYSYVAYDL